MSEIKIEGLSCSYKEGKTETVVLDNINLTFESNKTHVILGSSGGGKTTLLKCISGLKDYTGHIYFDDIPVDNVPIREREIGYVNQNFSLYPHLNIFNSIAFPLKTLGVPPEEIKRRVYEICDVLKISDYLSRKPKQLSVGQVQRAAIARAVIKRPQICLMDEPFSNIDEETKTEIRLYLKNKLHELGVTTIYVTHDLKEATSFADYIYLLNDGKIIFKGTVNEVLESKNIEVKEFFETLKNETF